MASLFSTKKENAIFVPSLLLKALGVKFNYNSLKETLEGHPDYPSILAVSDTLTEWGIANQTYQIEKEDFNNDNLLFPFIATTNTNGSSFVLVNKIENGLVYTDRDHNDFDPPTIDGFLHCWKGIVLHGTVDEKSGQPDYDQKRFSQLLKDAMAPTAVLVLFFIIFSALTSQRDAFGTTSALISTAVLIFLKLAGLTVSILLLMQSLNGNNPFIRNLCSLGGKNGCNAILKSDAAKVTSWLSWSEVGFFYFAGSFLALLFIPSSLILLAWFNLLALPYTIYSIGYQYKHKNWCVLCCAVQAILVLEAMTFFWHLGTYNLSLTTYNILLTASLFLLPILAWAFLKPFFIAALQLKPAKKQLNKFKYNTELFTKALTSQAKYAMGEDLKPIVIGNEHARNVITMVSNPFCGPCAQAHQTLEAWLKYREDLQLNIIITAAANDETERKEMALHINALNAGNNKEKLADALHEWFGLKEKDHSKWMANYPTPINGEENELLKKQRQWCDLAEITLTPTIFLNGYKLPEPYNWQDLKYLIT